MIAAIVPLLVTITGASLSALSTSNPKLAKMGEQGFFVGLFWLVFLFADSHIHLN